MEVLYPYIQVENLKEEDVQAMRSEHIQRKFIYASKLMSPEAGSHEQPLQPDGGVRLPIHTKLHASELKAARQ